MKRAICSIFASASLVSAPTLATRNDEPAGSLATADAEQTQDQAAHVQTLEEAIEQDAQGYSRSVGVSLDEARQRIRAIRELRTVKMRLQQTHGSRLAGIATEHAPKLQVSVLLTGDTAVPSENVSAGGLNVPIVFRTGARSTVEQLRVASKEHAAAIRVLLPNLQGTAISSRTGELVAIVTATGAAATAALAKDAELEALTGVPIRVRAVDGTDQDMDVRGGSKVTGCTSGFVVKNTSGTTGVATAAHCGNSITYYNPNGTSIPLTMVAGSEYGYGSQDVQIHTSAYVERAEFYVNTEKTQVRRPVGSYELYATWEGDNACHRGETTGASCSFVEYVFYRPSPPDRCGGYCADTYVAVTGPRCGSGDSGGPVYDLDLARGLLKGGNYSSTNTCNYYFYMPMDYLSSGWTLLLG